MRTLFYTMDSGRSIKGTAGNSAKNCTGRSYPQIEGASSMVAHSHTEPEYLSLVTAAEILDVNERTVRNWIREGRIQSYRMGPRQIRIKRADLDALLKPILGQ